MRGLIQVSDTVSVLDNAVIFNPSVNTLKETVEWIPEKWVNPFNTEDTSATHPLWLVAIVWNYRMWFPDLPNSTSWVEQVITSTIQGLKSVYETYYFTKLKSFEFETDQATFKQWLAENRCIAVRRPGNPCA
ncbi:MAG: hypothetical protein Kow0031_07470 [Anaerolineae bacterium]